MTQTPHGFEGRSTFIDALRGIAAFSVACYHITRWSYGSLQEPASDFIPSILQVWFDHGWVGVQVFFVISGFVIAYSVRNARITPGYLANYVLRRSIRLDPPSLGRLIVLYEHKVYVQGVVWGVNAFDQWGGSSSASSCARALLRRCSRARCRTGRRAHCAEGWRP
jgi:hypothetical protein